MDRLHRMLRTIRGETKAAKPHVNVFREFIAHLERASRAAPPRPPKRRPPARAPKPKRKRGG
jgi:hypothetical protein